MGTPPALRRFWTMLAHTHGNLLNASELGRSFGAADTTIRRYLDLLTGTFMICQLQPWHANIAKRQVKASKIYFLDSGLLHALLNVCSKPELLRYPKLGASWEGFALEEIIRAHNVHNHECYFWSTYSGAEVDLLLLHRGLENYLNAVFIDSKCIILQSSAKATLLHSDNDIFAKLGQSTHKIGSISQ